MECLPICDRFLNPLGYCPGECFTKCSDVCRVLLLAGDDPFPPPCSPAPPAPPPSPSVYVDTIHGTLVNGTGDNNEKHIIFTSLIIMACLLGVSLVIGILCMLFRVCYNMMRRNPTRSRSSPIIFNTQDDDFFDEEQGPVVDHPIWYINTVGLPQSVIDSIVSFRFRKGEGLVEGSDCSVCLSEFRDDETLRLLPKCSHAFHLGCIDTWLRSHKNCPLCRAPVVSLDFDVRVDVSGPMSSSVEPWMGSFDGSGSSGGLMGNPGGEDGVGEVRIGAGNDCVVGSLIREDEIDGGRLKLDLDHSILRDQFRIRSDLVENREDVGTEMQPMRRSVSLDSSSALAIYNAMSQVIPGKEQGICDSQQTKRSRVKRIDKRGSTGSLSFRKLMKSSSIGRSLQRGPVSMKRSFSSSGKSLSSSSSGDV